MQTSEDLAKSLHPLEVRVLLGFTETHTIDAPTLETTLGYNRGQANQAISWLSQKGYIEEIERSTVTRYELTELGREYRDNGTPEERILRVLETEGPKTMPELGEALGLENRDTGSAYGVLSKAGAVAMDDDKRVRLVAAGAADGVASVRALLDRTRDGEVLDASSLSDGERAVIGRISKKRGAGSAAFRQAESEEVRYRLTAAGVRAQQQLREAGVTGDEIGAVTPQMLRHGTWKGRQFRAYNISLQPGRVVPGRRNPYCEYLDHVKNKLVSLGFQEFDGPLVETEFWNSDALFMPQFHSARDIHDVYYVDQPRQAKEIEEPYLSQVASTHEDGWQTGSRGWGYGFDRDFTRRLILRSQGTVLSAKQLPKAEVPGKYFGVVRCFRYDQVDATHLADFYQTEGIVLGPDVNLRTLLGFLEMFAVELAGATDVKYVPGYFPFTEPSVEVHIKHPVLGWFELGGSGIFRPEVTEPLGVEVPVAAWGLGIDRMALMHLGLDDLRELFSADIENVRLRRAE